MSAKIPQMNSIQELARFWDRHDLTDFEDELEEVPEPVFDRPTMVKVPLSVHEVKAVKKIAKAKGVRYTDLIRDWVQEKVGAS